MKVTKEMVFAILGTTSIQIDDLFSAVFEEDGWYLQFRIPRKNPRGPFKTYRDALFAYEKHLSDHGLEPVYPSDEGIVPIYTAQLEI